MNKQELMDKVKMLMENETFKAKLEEANDLDEMAAVFQAEGINVTGADMETIAANIQGTDELTEENLDAVAGGMAPIVALGIIAFVGGSLLLGYIDGVKKKAKSCKVRR